MNNQTIEKLQFNEIKLAVKAKAIGEYSKQRIEDMLPHSSLETVKTRQTETKESRLILESSQHVPFMGLARIDTMIKQVKKGMILSPKDLIECADFLRSSRMIRKFFEKNQFQTPLLYRYSQSLPDLTSIEERIYEVIVNNQVADDASRQLKKIRNQVREVEKEIEEKLLKFLRHPANKQMIQESMIVHKGEHYTIPIKASYKNKIAGTIIEQSGRGITVFVEPTTITKSSEKRTLLKSQEVTEEYQLLAELSGYLAEEELTIQLMLDTISTFDVIFARGKYSREIAGITPRVNKEERIQIKKGRHPLLLTKAVPLDFTLGENYRGLVITGANAGGKTVVLKTVGLLTLMTMFGLQIPVDEGTEIAVFDQLFVDIGDQQNIENALSTFSGHMENLAGILRKTKRQTLVLLDEIGSGTQPNEGAALAIAIMESLYHQGALLIATTHYGEIKRFAQIHEDFMPAAMAFNRETLSPEYTLHIGQTGDSQALWIANKVQMPQALVQQAANYIDTKDYPKTKKNFKQASPKATSEKTSIQLFSKGDRVYLTESHKVALVYEDEGEQEVLVYINQEVQPILRRRLRLDMSASELYPAGYDLATLFVDFAMLKRNRDILRGSKKAHKQLAKEMQERKKKQKD